MPVIPTLGVIKGLCVSPVDQYVAKKESMMRSFLFTLLLVVTILSSCVLTSSAIGQEPVTPEPPSPTAPMTMDPQQRIEIVSRWYSTRDYTMLTDTLDWHHAPGFFGGEQLTTRAQVENELLPFYLDVFDNIEVEIDRIEAGQSSVFSIGTYVLTPKNSPQTYRAPFVHVWTLDSAGKLAGLVQYADTLIISQALAGARVLRTAPLDTST